MHKIKNAHLIISIIVLLPVALCYGISPGSILPLWFDFKVETVDLHQVFRAIMGLYLGNIIIWGAGILYPAYWKMATVMNVVFMSGLAFGRLISLLIDGLPSTVWQVGFLMEVGLAIWGIVNLKK